MNRMPIIIVGIFLTFLSAWLGLVAYPYVQLGDLQPITLEDTGEVVPPAMTGNAISGQQVYASEGCVYCHSQQIRQPYITTSDLLRGWGGRPTVARDYIRQDVTFLGTMRTGPDLTNIGVRQPSAEWHHQHLYEPTVVMPGSIMPAFRYLYKVQKIETEPSAEAIPLEGPYAPAEGYEVVPTEEAKNLVAYLLSLKRNYPLPEAPEPELEP